MGPNDPWSPEWRPDEKRERLRRILVARRGALLAGALWIPVALVAARQPELIDFWQRQLQPAFAIPVVVIGTAGVALLGAGLATGTLGSRIDAFVAGLALAVGAPVAAVASMLIAALVVDSVIDAESGQIEDMAGTVLRTGVLTAVRVLPLIVLAAGGWVFSVRRYAARLGILDG